MSAEPIFISHASGDDAFVAQLRQALEGDAMGRLEEAATFYQQAIIIDVQLQDLANEGLDRNNLANTLIKLQRYDEARRELQRAIECKQPYGHAATPWNAWNALCELEQATDNPSATAEARQQAIQSYLAYRRDGGENQRSGAELYSLAIRAIQQHTITDAEQSLAEYLGPDAGLRAKTLIPKLQAILHGSRDPALDYDDAAELLLLERVGA